MAKDFFGDIIKLVGNDVASIASDSTIADNNEFVDTGCYTLNIVLSGSIFGGAPMNKVVGFAAEEAVGKSYLIIQIINKFLKDNPDARVIYNDTEGRIDKEMLARRGVDASRVLMLYPETIEQFKNINYQIIDNYRAKDGDKEGKSKNKKTDKPKLMIVADSLSQLPSVKERTDASGDKEAGDMGLRAKAWRSAFRVLRQPLSKAKIPMFCTNHTYKTTGMFPTNEVAGGGGFKYAADIIAMMGKEKDTDDKTKIVKGSIIHFKVAKGWNVKQHSQFKCYLSYTTGLDQFFGLEALAVEAGIFKKVHGGYELPDGNSVSGRELLLSPKDFYTTEILQKIDAFVKERYCFSDSGQEETLSELAESIQDEE